VNSDDTDSANEGKKGYEKADDNNGDNYYGYGYLTVSTWPDIPVTTVFTKRSKRQQNMPFWTSSQFKYCLGCSAMQPLKCLHYTVGVYSALPTTPYNPLNVNNPSMTLCAKPEESLYDQRSRIYQILYGNYT